MDENGGLEGIDNVPGFNPLQREKTILDLPAELLRLIFRYMTHTQKLTCRLVCTDWNLQVSTILGKTSYFELTSLTTNETILDSNVEWTKIKLSDLRTALPKEFKELVSTLQLIVSVPEVEGEFPYCMKLLNSFHGLKTLHIEITEEKKKSDAHEKIPATQFGNLRSDFRKMMRGLEELSVTFPDMNYKSLNEFLEEVRGRKMCLKKLCIKENWPTDTSSTLPADNDDHVESLLSHVHRIISTSSSTLTFLDLDFNSDKIRNELMPVLVSKLSEVKELKLKSALIRHNPIEEHIERDFPILQEFLNIQMTTGVLKNIILPWSSNASLCQDVVKSLPRDIESVGNVRTDHITNDFPSKFNNLSLILLGANITRDVLPEDCDNIRQLQVDLKKYEFDFDSGETFYSYFTNMFPNLTELKIVCNGDESFFDVDLQNITSDLKQLRVLHIENCDVSDRGVIGVEHDDENLMELVRTRKLYFYPNCIPEDDLLQDTLCSLKNLEKLFLTGTEITDVGIVLGFRFGSKLKHLTLGTNSDKVSDLGFHCLGANNPGLEAFYGYFRSGRISAVGIENLKRQLPFMNSTQKFVLVNVEPVPYRVTVGGVNMS